MTVTGVILYLGYGGWWVWVHSITAFVGFGYIFLHVVTHYLLRRLVAALPPVPPRQAGDHARRCAPIRCLLQRQLASRPLRLQPGVDWTTRDTLVITRVNSAPRSSMACLTTTSGQRPGRSMSIPSKARTLAAPANRSVEVRAVHDGQTRLLRVQMGRPDPFAAPRAGDQEGGWLAFSRHARRSGGRQDFYEDKLAIGILALADIRQRREHLSRHQAARRQAGPDPRIGLSLHRAGQPDGRVAVESLARRPSRLCR